MFVSFSVEVSADLDKALVLVPTQSAQTAIQQAMVDVVNAIGKVACVTTAKATLTCTASIVSRAK